MNNEVIKKISDVITIVAPSIVSALGILGATNAIPMFNEAVNIVMVILGALTTAASATYNAVAKP